MEWRPYASCCHASALAPNTAFCGECGRMLLRCMAFQECMSLVTPHDPCPMCIAPSLFLEKGAVVSCNRGARLSIPLVFRNSATVQRPLRVESIAAFAGRGETPVALAWEHVEAQTERRFNVDTAPFEEAGLHAVGIVITMATRYKGREERYAFAAHVKIAVEAPEHTEIVQNFNLAGAQLGTGTLINASPQQRPSARAEATPLGEREALLLERAERYEMEKGIRGYAAASLRVPRTLGFTFQGFPANDRPADGATIGQNGALACGRSGRHYDAETNPLPNDLSLRPYKRNGELDEEAAMFISRHHFDFVVLNDRLCVQARGANGLQVGSRKLANGEIAAVEDGDRIFPMPGHPDKLSLRVRFLTSLGSVETAEITRIPAVVVRRSAEDQRGEPR